MNSIDEIFAVLILIAAIAIGIVAILGDNKSPEYIISHPEPGVTCYKKRGVDAISCLRDGLPKEQPIKETCK